MDEKIFTFQDGTLGPDGAPKTVHADPMEIQMAMSAALGGDVNGVADRAVPFDEKTGKGHPPEIAQQNMLKLVAAIRRAFGLAGFDRATGSGATVAKCYEVWNQFCDFMAEKKIPTI